MRRLAGIWSVLRMIPATLLCSFGVVSCVFAATAYPLASTLGIVFTLYGAWRGYSRNRALYGFMAIKP